MKEQDQIKAIAELDGYKFPPDEELQLALQHDPLMDYLHSYDAIIPVIQKQNLLIMTEVGIQLQILWKKSGKGIPTSNNTEGWIAWTLITTPSQLCEALLRATGKWTAKARVQELEKASDEFNHYVLELTGNEGEDDSGTVLRQYVNQLKARVQELELSQEEWKVFVRLLTGDDDADDDSQVVSQYIDQLRAGYNAVKQIAATEQEYSAQLRAQLALAERCVEDLRSNQREIGYKPDCLIAYDKWKEEHR